MVGTREVAKETGGGSGKWRQRGVPHKGWTHVDTEDLDEPSETCEMCEAVEIRYVHIMEHPDYDGPLRVGCVCAENMSGDKLGPKRRERELANAASRRRNWLTRKWRESRKGNPFLNTKGYNVAVYRVGGGWSYRIVKDNPLAGYIAGEVSRKWDSRRVYETEDRAKLAAFDRLTVIRADAE